jgi:Ca2+-binding RTX toxin-like protein
VKEVFVINLIVLTLTILLPTNSFAESSGFTVTGKVNIEQLIQINNGGTGTFSTPTNEILTLTLPSGMSGSLQVGITDIANPTNDGFAINFLAETLHITVNPSNACTSGCVITFTFTDEQMAATGISNLSTAKIFQDTEQDGTFVRLATTLTDGPPSPYTVSATITSTSIFGIGNTESDDFCGKTSDQFDHIIDGTEKNDKLVGTSGNDLIRGFGGNDVMMGKEGDDCLVGGTGNDKISGGKGNDMIIGQEGNDRIFGNDGNDLIQGGTGNDIISGGNGDDTIDGEEGNNKISGGNGTDKCFDDSGSNTFNSCESKKPILDEGSEDEHEEDD